MTEVLGCVLAGGLARRMGGGDKGFLSLGGKPILERVIERIEPQVSSLVINANGDPERFARFGIPVVPDSVEGFAGPLAGVLAGLEWTRTHAPSAQWVVTAATDTPFFPPDLVSRFLAACEGGQADLAAASSRGRAHPVFGLWPVRLAEDLRRAMTEEGIRKVDLWTARHSLALVDFDAPYDPFFNANRPEDLSQAEALLKAFDP